MLLLLLHFNVLVEESMKVQIANFLDFLIFFRFF